MLAFVINILITWRISSLLVHEAGPGDLLGWLREKAGIAYDEASQRYAKNTFAEALLCLWCVSMWIGWGVALAGMERDWLARGLAYSAGAILVERAVRR